MIIVTQKMIEEVESEYKLNTAGVQCKENRQYPSLVDSVDSIQYVCNWLEEMNFPKRKASRLSSYSLKHYAENGCSPKRYVSNGEFIVGAILMSYTPFSYDSASPNLDFNISVKDVHKKLRALGVENPASHGI